MPEINYKNAGKQPFMDVVRALVRAYQAFTAYDVAGLRDTGLTPAQADVLFTLGNTNGMTFKEIGEMTLITKGTLTGVVDRMEEKRLVKRVPGLDDKRCMRVSLTAKGEKLFRKVFPQQVAYLQQSFDRLSEQELAETERVLARLKSLF